jgi:hypothetical protein
MWPPPHWHIAVPQLEVTLEATCGRERRAYHDIARREFDASRHRCELIPEQVIDVVQAPAKEVERVAASVSAVAHEDAVNIASGRDMQRSEYLESSVAQVGRQHLGD